MAEHEKSTDAELTEEDMDFEETAESHDEDVESALQRETQDGKGGAVVPKATFKSYSTDEVEAPDSKDENQES